MPYIPTDADRDASFPLEREYLPDTFEIGIALAGTVSAGAYTAGVLDYLGEALDAWTAAKERGDAEAPQHSVLLTTVAGASGGGLNAAILARTAACSVPRGAVKGNPFYDAWAGDQCVTLEALLAPGPAGRKNPGALLNTRRIETLIGDMVSTKGAPLPDTSAGRVPQKRSWLSDPLRLLITLSNLSGTPYRVPVSGQAGTGFDIWRHDDLMRFALRGVGVQLALGRNSRLGEIALHPESDAGWNSLREAALATCAFPVAFDIRDVTRSSEQIAARAVAVPGNDGTGFVVRWLEPRWEAVNPWLAQSNAAAMVDGGATNNEPIALVHSELAGLVGSNDRSATEARRALLLVDPFAAPGSIPARPASFAALAGSLINLLLQQSRYSPADILSAVDDTVFSRFLIAPGPEGAGGEAPLASAGLGGFGGFVDKALLDHDFKRGRYDAFLFLTRNFRFPPENAVFRDKWTKAQRRTFTTGIYDYRGQDPETAGYLPMIPLVKALRDNPPEPPGKIDAKLPEHLDKALDARLDYLFERVAPEIFDEGWGKLGLKLAWPLGLRAKLRKKIREAITAGLKPTAPP